MNKLILFIMIAMFSELSFADSARVCFYEDVQYSGSKFCVTVGARDRDLARTGWKRRISSVKIDGAASVTLYQGASFSSTSLVLKQSQPDLRGAGWNDVASSFITALPPARVCFYQDINWAGRVFCLAVGQQASDLVPGGWNDTISSIRIEGRAVAHVFEDTNFGGHAVWVSQSISSMNIFGSAWNDRISSIRVSTDAH